MINELFLKVFNSFLNDKELFKQSPKPRKTEDFISAQVLLKQLPLKLHESSNLGDSYLFKGSFGVGNVPEIPHVCLFDTAITTSAQYGYYIVYLFDSTLDNVVLSLNQGWTGYEKKYGIKEGKKQILQNSEHARTALRSIGIFDFTPIFLNARGTLGKGYELGNICSITYSRENLPEDRKLIDDLRNLVGVYRELKGMVGLNILDISSIKDEESYQEAINEIRIQPISEMGPQNKLPVIQRISGYTYPRDPSIAAIALANANYKCENEPLHTTFLSMKSGKQFVEAHHLIPLEFFNEFTFSIDVPSNIVSLCPTCHRAFHFSTKEEKRRLIQKFFYNRKQRLNDAGIDVTLAHLLDYYKILEESAAIAN